LRQECLIFFFISSGAKNFQKRARLAKGEPSDAEAAAAIPFPLKPLFLAAAADAGNFVILSAFNFQEFLIK